MQRIHVVAAVFRRGDEVLACRRAPGKSAAGKWEFPGGKVDPGEQPPDALARELHEELGVDARVGEHLDRSVTAVGDLEIDLDCFFVDTDTAPESSTDHDELRWVSRADLADLDWAAPDLPAVALLIHQTAEDSAP